MPKKIVYLYIHPPLKQSIARVLSLNRTHNLESFSSDASIISGCCLDCVLFIIGPSRRLMSASVSRIMWVLLRVRPEWGQHYYDGSWGSGSQATDVCDAVSRGEGGIICLFSPLCPNCRNPNYHLRKLWTGLLKISPTQQRCPVWGPCPRLRAASAVLCEHKEVCRPQPSRRTWDTGTWDLRPPLARHNNV